MTDTPVQKFNEPPKLSPFIVSVRGEKYPIDARDSRDAIVRVLNPLGLIWRCEPSVTVVPAPEPKPKKEFSSLRRVK